MSNQLKTPDNDGWIVLTAITLIFSVAKITNVLDWNWVWILLPLWFPIFVILTVYVVLISARKAK